MAKGMLGIPFVVWDVRAAQKRHQRAAGPYNQQPRPGWRPGQRRWGISLSL